MEKRLIKISFVLAIITFIGMGIIAYKLQDKNVNWQADNKWYKVGYRTYITPRDITFNGNVATFAQMCDSPRNIYNPDKKKLEPEYEIKIG